MKVCSFLPAATRMIFDMGLGDLLYGVTFECPQQALNEKQVVVRCSIDDKDSSSREIDKIFSACRTKSEALYYIDESPGLAGVNSCLEQQGLSDRL
jgi:iron complex transport system substrate-binding protein